VRSAAGLAVRLGRPPGPSARGRPLAPSAGGRPTRTFVRKRGRPDAPGRRLSDVIFSKDVRCDNPTPVTRIRVVLNCIPILGARQLLETVLDIFVLPACQSATAHAEVVDFSLAFFRPPGWRRSDGVVKLVRRSVQQFPHDLVVLETP
jgi:hypothetical protein